MRQQTKLIVINNYPKDSKGNRKRDEVLKAAMKNISKNSTKNYFLALTALGNGFEYRVIRIANDTGLTKSQVSRAKKHVLNLD